MINLWKWRDFRGREYILRYIVDEKRVKKSKFQFGINEQERVKYVKEKLKLLIDELSNKGIKLFIHDDLSFEYQYPASLDPQDILRKVSDTINKAVNEFYRERGFIWNKETNILEIDYRGLAKKYSKEMRVFSSFLFRALGRPTDKYALLEGVLSFVQNIKYGVPANYTGERNRAGLFTPWETLFYGYGDCDSKSLLFASIWENLAPEIPYVFIQYIDASHVNMGVKNIWNLKGGDVVLFQNNEYLICEVSACCHLPGENPFRGKRRIRII